MGLTEPKVNTAQTLSAKKLVTNWVTKVRFPAGERSYFFIVASIPTLAPTRAPIQ
jgi:hypothetical protein